MNVWWKRALAAAVVTVVAVLVWRALQPQPVLVDVEAVRRDRLVVTVDDDGRTRVRERYTVSAPIAGRLLRTALEPGDPVQANATRLAEFAPVAASLLDARGRAEAEARLRRAEASVHEAEARREQVRAEAAFAESALQRTQELHAGQVLPTEQLEAAERDAERARAGLRAAEMAVRVALHERELAAASLREPAPGDVGETRRTSGSTPDPEARHGGVHPVGSPAREGPDAGRAGARVLGLRSPIDGLVLRVFEQSARTLAAGEPILEVGNIGSLEIVADYLTQDAVRIRPGMRVLVQGWGGEDGDGEPLALEARVQRIEPSGFTKVSALGVEEQRVNVVVDPDGDVTRWATAGLGDGFRVELRIVVWEEDGVLVVPTGALFRQAGAWAVFVVDDGRARLRRVALGRRGALEARVLEGLAEGDTVVLYPSELIGDGAPVEPREPAAPPPA